MYEYQVISEMAELPRGSYFYAIPDEIEPGELALFKVGESHEERIIIGRWYPDVGGYHWIKQPRRWIKIARDVLIKVIGRIIPIPAISGLYWAIVGTGLTAEAILLTAAGKWEWFTTAVVW